mgnify:CR=1 FL=1
MGKWKVFCKWIIWAKSYKEQAQALENAGYSTAKDEEGNLIYGDKLIRVIQENNLMLYDTKVQRK